MNASEPLQWLGGPIEPAPAERQVRAANLAGFAGLVRSFGGDPRAILEQHGIAPRAAACADNHIDCAALIEVLEDCSRRFGDPLFGLKLGSLQSADVYGCVAVLCEAAPTVRDALSSLVEYVPVAHCPESRLELVEGKETAELRWRVETDFGPNLQAHYQAVLLNMDLMRAVLGEDFRLSYFNIAAEPTDGEAVARSLNCRVNGDADVYAMGFPTALLSRPTRRANKLVHSLLKAYLDSLRAQRRPTLAEQVERYLRGALGSGECSAEGCARKLGMSVRALQSQLAREDARFSELLERNRLERARAWLAASDMSLAEISQSLNYADQTCFGRAFKRWMGVSPRRYRIQARGAA